jgi:hypothetical protein
MRKDQRIKLAALSEKLADYAIEAADPSHWGVTTPRASDMSKEERYDATLNIKYASAAVGLLVRVEQVVASRNPVFDGVNEPSVDGEIKAAEKKAEELLGRVMKRHGKAQA